MDDAVTQEPPGDGRTGAACSRKQLLRIAGGAGLSLALGSSSLATLACGGDDAGTAGSRSASEPVGVGKAPTDPFVPRSQPGLKPDLPRRLGYSLPAESELFALIDRTLRQAAEDRGLEYASAQANGDSAKQFQQTQGFLARGVGALLAVDLAAPALAPVQLEAIRRGVAVMCGPFANSTCQATTDQYALGHAQGQSAVRWIEENLDGRAQVSLFNEDHIPSIRPRGQGVRDALKEGGPGIELVSDIGVKTPNADEGFKVTRTVLQRHPDVNVWLGVDGVLAGTLAALRATGKAGDGTGLFGNGGEAQALKAIAEGGPYKSTQAFPFPVIAYAWGTYAADWLDGKSIPLVMRGAGIELNSQATIDAFEQAMAAPAQAFAENEKTSTYFTPLGNTSYEDNRYLTIVA